MKFNIMAACMYNDAKLILKSGPLFISSKGIGWTSWKKRWFVLSRKSLMFYRLDPNALPQKGSEAPNPTLGGIELNNSGSVVVKADKKLLTVLFPDGRDGRAFTLKTETFNELNEWKAALEVALAQAPSACQVMGHSGIFFDEVVDSIEALAEQCKDTPPTTSSVIGRPVLLALQEIDGSPSFLEKAFRFIEEHGIKVEGILRQSADVEEVMRRVQEYEQGKTEFAPDEDAHVIGDCIKHVLREMPSSPVPASCCTSLVEAYRTYCGSRAKSIRDAIYDTFPEPNRHLLQRTLQMILTVAAHKAVNRMSLSALAACMAPLLLRPLVAGECELNNDLQIDRDESFQLLQAAAAANHAQAIVIILLEEYKNIFDDESFSSEIYTESEDENIEGDESTDEEISKDDGCHEVDNDLKADAGGDTDRSYSGTASGSDNDVGNEDGSDLGGDVGSDIGSDIGKDDDSSVRSDGGCDVYNNGGDVLRNDVVNDIESNLSRIQDTIDISALAVSARNNETVENTGINSNKVPAQPAMRNKWGRTSARKNLSVESFEYISDDESEVQRLESAKIDLQTKLSEEIKRNAVLQSRLDERKQTLHKCRLALEKEVSSVDCSNQVLWKGSLTPNGYIQKLPDQDSNVQRCQRIFNCRNSSKVDRLPLSIFRGPSNVTEIDLAYSSHSTLMESLTYPEILHKFRTIVRVVTSYTWQAKDLLTTGNYRVRLMIEDSTARIHAYIFGEDGVKFFNGYPPIDVLTKKMNRLLGIRGSLVRRNPPWAVRLKELLQKERDL